jgi:site-specific DNA recombinase
LSVGEIAARQGASGRYVRRIIRLAFLAPELVEAIVQNRQSPVLTAKKLALEIELPLDWEEQKRVLAS